MFFRRILALGALFAAAGCTPGNNPPQTATPALPREIEREVGTVYPSPTLQALVDRVGQRVAAQARIGGFRFYVIDQPLANAHALSSGQVFVTRGLLALLDDEAELAAAIGHELGHVSQRHASQRARARRQVMEAAVEATLASGSVTVGRSVARTGLLELRRYSREQEFEADRVGVGYLVQAGYRGDAMASLIEKLRRQSQLEDLLLGPAEEPPEQRGALSTHPAPDARLAALRSVEAARTPGDSNRAAYLALIDGMSVDDAPEEGFVHGTTFVHPVMRLAFTVPEGFKLFNGHEGVLAFGPDRSLIFFSCSAERVEGGLDDWMRDRLKPTPTDIQSIEIGGAPAAIGARPRGSDTGLAQIRYVLIRHGDGICAFNLTSDSPNRDRRIETLIAAAKSFRALSPAEVTALRPYRLRILEHHGERRESARELALRLPYPDLQLQRLLALNGVDDEAAFDRLTEIKTVEP